MSTQTSKDSTYTPMDIGDIDDTSATDEEETTHDLAMMKGGKDDPFPDYCNYCWTYGLKLSQCRPRHGHQGRRQGRESKTRVKERVLVRRENDFGEAGRTTAKDTTDQATFVDIICTNRTLDERTRRGTPSLVNGWQSRFFCWVLSNKSFSLPS